MFSSKYDTVLDPFLGTATTSLAAISLTRNSIGFEVDPGFRILHRNEIPSPTFIKSANTLVEKRMSQHIKDINARKSEGKSIKYTSNHYRFPVITKQEVDILFENIENILFDKKSEFYIAKYKTYTI